MTAVAFARCHECMVIDDFPIQFSRAMIGKSQFRIMNLKSLEVSGL